MAFKGKKKFEYKPRDEAKVKARATAGGNREGFLADGVKTFAAKAGTHTVRILPPTWEDAEHYGYDVYAHYNIGPDGGAYLCLQKMQEESCAICADRARATKEDDEELEEALKPRQRVACWIIDRDNEKDGPLLWMMPWTLDREIVQQSIDKKSGEVYNLDSDEEGYDVSFERTGEGKNTKYVGVQLDRRSSPLSDDDELSAEWLEFVKDNPVPDQMVFQTSGYLEELVGDGLSAPKSSRDKAKGKGKDKDDDRKSTRPERARLKKRGDDDDDDTDKKKSSRKNGAKDEDKIDIEDLDWKQVHAMKEDELIALAEQEEIDIEEATDEEEAADAICKALKLKEEKDEPKKLGGRLGALKKKLGASRGKD